MQEEHYDVIYQGELNHWWYRVRRKIVVDILRRYTERQNRKLSILDVGCGMGALMQEIQRFGEVSGVDVSEQAINFSKSRGVTNAILGDAAQLPYPDQSFDVVVILDVLEHLKDDAVGAREVARVLKRGGLTIVAVPAFMFLWSVTDELSHHYRRYTRKEVVRVIQDANLSVEKASYFNTFLFPAIAGVRLLVRLLGIKMKSENTVGGAFVNTLFYMIFYIESFFLKYISFPFGVSVLVLATKK